MSRLNFTFERLRKSRRKGLIPYITAGDPHPDQTVTLMRALAEAGADAIELGVPFSDPMADGPVIQAACERALAHGTHLWRVLEMVAEFRRKNSTTPVVLMGYLNPIETRGVDAFAARAKDCGVDGVLVVDLAVEEAPDWTPRLRAHGLDCIFLLAPTSTEARIEAIAREASGYLYYVSLKGVTGSDRLDVTAVAQKVSGIRRHTALPIAVGFGVRDAQTVAAVGAVADAVVVGSALVAEIEKHQKEPQALTKILGDKLRLMRKALDASPESRVPSSESRVL